MDMDSICGPQTDNTLICGHLAKDVIDGVETYGGPAGIISLYLAENYGYVAKVHSVLGTDKFSEDYLSHLASKGIDEDLIHVVDGEISICTIENHADSTQEIAWEENVSEPFPSYDSGTDYLRHLLIPTAPSEIATEILQDLPEDCYVLYTPGQYLGYMSPDEILFDEIIGRANYLQLNSFEQKSIVESLGLSSLQDLFSYQNLEVIVVTGKQKNLVFTQDDSFEVPVETNDEVKNTTGAGDVFLSSFFYHYQIEELSLTDSCELATEDATAWVNQGGLVSESQ